VTADGAQLAVALELATAAHRGQVYPSPEREPYICHPIRVMEALEEGDDQIVALLHDVLEDTSVDVAELRELGFDEHIVRAVLLLTHDSTVPYADYIERLAHDPLARRVKLADLADNLRNNRRLESTSGVRGRISRYEAAQHFLEAWSLAV
jgi:(p)ppGpp synthase/HD superfamily hydrolase